MRTGENIYKRKDGRWEARYRKGRKDNGRILYASCYGKTYTEAKQKLEAVKKGLQPTEAKAESGAPLFGEICEEWLRCHCLRLKQSTCVKYQSTITKYLIPGLGSLRISDISTEIIGKFSFDLLNRYGLAPKTATDILVLLHSILEYGSRHYPAANVHAEIVYPKKVVKEMRVLTLQEQENLTKFLLKDINPCKFGVLIALWTGLRIGELCALRWEHICVEEQLIRVEATMQRLHTGNPHAGSKTQIIQDAPKTASALRIIPLGHQTSALCRRMDPHNENAYILTGSEKYMEPRLLQYHFQRYLSSCGLEGVTFHTLRHTFATRCVEVGFEIKSLSEILGHANTVITLNRYVHCSLDLKRENMNKLEVFQTESPS